ncbi:MAG: hypothetical protein PHU25_22510, partial [Deltaproteobacteria bacterium]|nr:hypothetical protein [Deltaproteobacteria bacterium]
MRIARQLTKPGPVRTGLALAAFACFGLVWGWTRLNASPVDLFSPDSYACYLIGKNLFSGHGFSTFAIRDLHDTPAWPLPSRSFAPVLPFLVGLVDWLGGLGINSGVVVNWVFFLGTLITVSFLGRALDK